MVSTLPYGLALVYLLNPFIRNVWLIYGHIRFTSKIFNSYPSIHITIITCISYMSIDYSQLIDINYVYLFPFIFYTFKGFQPYPVGCYGYPP